MDEYLAVVALVKKVAMSLLSEVSATVCKYPANPPIPGSAAAEAGNLDSTDLTSPHL